LVDIDRYSEQALSERKSELLYTFKIEAGKTHVLTFCFSIAAYSIVQVMGHPIWQGRLINQLQLVTREGMASCKVFQT
jgi:hypothetical protein